MTQKMRLIVMTGFAAIMAAGAAFVVTLPGRAADEAAQAGKATEEKAGTTMRIATVDVQQLINDSKAGQSIQKQLSVLRDELQKDVTAEEEKLMKEQEALAQARQKLTAEEFALKRVSFEKNVLETRSTLQRRGREIDIAANEALNQLRVEITDIVFEMAEEEDIDLVLTRQNVVAGAKSLDVTESVMSALNKEVTEIKVKPKSVDTKG